MEKVLKGDEKIRKAEEIYYRRQMGLPTSSKTLNEGRKTYLGSKIVLELLIILNLSLIIVAIQNKEFIFTAEFLEMISQYNINLTEGVKSLIESEETENTLLEETNEVVTQNVLPINDVVPNLEDASSISQMELDIEKIKESYSFEKPINGTVTSVFGARESIYQNVSGYHTGVDIGAEKGTSIKSVVSGRVILVSNKGDYGKHVKIETDKMQTLYAHCSKILVEEGDYVNIGQEIAKVGSTGNSTGPHLHFEIKYEVRFVDPSRIIEF